LQRHNGLTSRHFEGAALLILRCAYHSLRINKTGNNSGAFLLTIRSLTSWCGNAPFTIVAWPERRSCDWRLQVEGVIGHGRALPGHPEGTTRFRLAGSRPAMTGSALGLAFLRAKIG
jgi:hypothetical protein